MLFSLKDLTSKLSPSSGERLHCIKTNTFVLHHFESLSGLVFVLNTKLEVPGESSALSLSFTYLISCVCYLDMFENLRHIYAHIFTEYVAKNPLYRLKPDEPIKNPLFAMKVEEYLLSLPAIKQG
ncbi:hypothetical protein EON64_06045 [archaeon]|nr:MAG: hypothetical protein EON64_06045 [archaeon]